MYVGSFRSGQRDGSGKGELSMKPFLQLPYGGFALGQSITVPLLHAAVGHQD